MTIVKKKKTLLSHPSIGTNREDPTKPFISMAGRYRSEQISTWIRCVQQLASFFFFSGHYASSHTNRLFSIRNKAKCKL